jgi:hypothetical protein
MSWDAGSRARAHGLLDWFFKDQRPTAWRQWAEVVWRDPKTPKFVGDMPHTWVGSDYVRSVTDMFTYEREADSALVLGAGVPSAWVTEAPGIAVTLPTHYGSVRYTMRAAGDSVRVALSGEVRVPPGGVVVRSPLDRPLRSASVDGRPAATRTAARSAEVVVNKVPSDIILRY